MTDTTAIRRRPDGSIDVEFYVANSRRHRSRKAHHAAKEATRRSGKAIVVLSILGIAALFRSGQV